jgi:hypothetical protein
MQPAPTNDTLQDRMSYARPLRTIKIAIEAIYDKSRLARIMFV